MSTAGPNSPGTLADDAAVGAVAWTNPGNAASSDNAYAVFSSSGVQQSHYLRATNFGFSIPAGATIDGVTVSIERKAGNNTNLRYVVDSVVRLVVGGTISGDNKANTGSRWPTSDASASYGGAADQWGLTLSATDVNGTGFGVVLSATSGGSNGSTTGSVDHITITITYTQGGTQYTQSASGSLTGAGDLVRQGQVVRTGSLTAGGMLSRLTGKPTTGSVTGAGTLVRQAVKAVLGSLTGAGIVGAIRTRLLSLAGSLTASGGLVRRTGRNVTGSLTGSGSQLRQTAKRAAGSITGSATLARLRLVLLSLAGSLAASGGVARQVGKLTAGTATAGGALSKRIGTAVSGLLTGLGGLVASLLARYKVHVAVRDTQVNQAALTQALVNGVQVQTGLSTLVQAMTGLAYQVGVGDSRLTTVAVTDSMVG